MRTKRSDSYWHFTKLERAGAVAIFTIVTVTILVTHYLPQLLRKERPVSNVLQSEMQQLAVQQQERANSYKKYTSNYPDRIASNQNNIYATAGELFYFDPNTISASEWIKLGVREKTVAVIMKYISKGGKFYKPDDIRKVWGLHPSLVERLIPYVRIASVTTEPKPYATYSPNPVKSYKIVALNSADSLQLQELPGIGPKLSGRILKYRDKLGGFYSVEQVGETFGLPDSVFQKIKQFFTADMQVRKININTATLEELRAHPYIRYHLANAIVEYRKQHGPFNKNESLKHIMLFNDSIYDKVSAYFTTGD